MSSTLVRSKQQGNVSSIFFVFSFVLLLSAWATNGRKSTDEKCQSKGEPIELNNMHSSRENKVKMQFQLLDKQWDVRLVRFAFFAFSVYRFFLFDFASSHSQ